jgi:hypothetical protein
MGMFTDTIPSCPTRRACFDVIGKSTLCAGLGLGFGHEWWQQSLRVPTGFQKTFTLFNDLHGLLIGGHERSFHWS